MNKLSLAALSLLISIPVFADEQTKENENVLIFTAEVANYIDLATDVQTLNNAVDSASHEQEIENKIKSLQQAGLRIADAYFQDTTDSTRQKYTEYLSTQLRTNVKLKNYFIFIGNAFVAEAARLIDARKSNLKKIQIWSTVGGVVLGLGGGALYLKFKTGVPTSKEWTTAGLIAVGIAAVGAAGGFASRYFIPVNQAVQNAQDFSVRYPHGEDFMKELQGPSNDLAMGLRDLDEAVEENN